MGYIADDKTTSTAFAQASRDVQELQKSKIRIKIYIDLLEEIGERALITITEDTSGIQHVFRAVAYDTELNDFSFTAYGGSEEAALSTMNNLRDCILRDSFFKSNFDVEILPPNANESNNPPIGGGYTLELTSKGYGKLFDCSITVVGIGTSVYGYYVSVEKSNSTDFYKIADVDLPLEITLANNPNFVTFSSINKDQVIQPGQMSLSIKDTGATYWNQRKVDVKITELESGEEHLFKGVYNVEDLADNTFLIDTSARGQVITLYNLRECMMLDTYIRSNYELNVKLVKNSENLLIGGNELELVSKGYGPQYDASIEAIYEDIGDKGTRSIELVLNPFYSNIKEGDDTTLSISCRKGLLAALYVYPFTGKLSLDANSPDNEYRIVKPNLLFGNEIEAKIETLTNLKTAMLKNKEISQMFDIAINNTSLILTYKVSYNYRLHGIDTPQLLFQDVVMPDIPLPSMTDYQVKYHFNTSFTKSSGIDSIDNGRRNSKIELDIYTDTGIEWGKQSSQTELGGIYLTTLSKSYFGRPLWFDLNTLMSKKVSYSPLFLTAFDDLDVVWIDPGTMIDYRFVARRTVGSSTEPIYMSDVLYTVNGYDYTLNDTHLGYGDTAVEDFVLDLSDNLSDLNFKKIRPLTTNMQRTHLIGQKQYLNCILKNDFCSEDKTVKIAILYKLYTQSGQKIGEAIDIYVDTDTMGVMNTAQLDLDQFLPLYRDKTVGQIKVCLVTTLNDNPTQKYCEITQDMTFSILPSGLHEVKDFAFLNRLGGWDSMNFGGSESNEFKASTSSIFKTLQPNFKHYSEIESVAFKSVEESFSIQSSPLTRSAVEWLREMAASPAVYELASRRYVLIDDMTLKYNSRDDLFQIDLKYHYSDVFNGRMK